MSVKLVFCLHRRPELTPEEFRRHWSEVHAPLVRERAAALGARRYEQSHPVDSPVSAVLASVREAPEAFDGVASLWFDSLTAMQESGSTPEGRRAARELLEDERRFIDLGRSPIWLVEDHRVV